MTKTTGVSLASLNARKAAEVPIEFEYVLEGKPTGLFFKVLGGQSTQVTQTVNRLVNERRKEEAAKAVQATEATFTPVEDDIAFGQRLSAVRLVGWRKPGETQGLAADQVERFQGIEDDWSAEAALTLCQTNPDIAAQVLTASNKLSNFIKASPTA